MSKTKSARPIHRNTAAQVLSLGQKLSLMVVLGLLGLEAYRFGWHSLLVILIAGCEVFYFGFVIFKLVLAIASYSVPLKPANGRHRPLTDADLPTFTLLLPLAKEKFHVIQALLDSICEIVYPAHLLQIVPCIDSDDVRLQRMFGLIPSDDPAQVLRLPNEITPALRLDLTPRTKPSALGFGLAAATGELTVIYDAEDSPSPHQLRRAAQAMASAKPRVACFQARLTFWNIVPGLGVSSWHWLRRYIPLMYYIEYAVHFDFVLRGMARLGLVPPLGGTSNIFKTDVLREIAIPTKDLVRGGIPESVASQMVAAWDPWNVTEDADIAAALARNGYTIQMVPDAWTIEEAPVSLAKTINQRTRWGKGYGQTGLVQLRQPLTAIRDMGFWRYFSFELMMLGTPLSLMINPIFWGLTIAYFVTHSTFIQSLFPAPIFYVGLLTGVLGNFMLYYLQITACLRDQEHGLIKYLFALGPWWLINSVAMWRGILELPIPWLKHLWHLSPHGHYDPAVARAAVQHRHELMSARS